QVRILAVLAEMWARTARDCDEGGCIDRRQIAERSGVGVGHMSDHLGRVRPPRREAAERTALSRTPEYRKVLALMDGLPAPAVKEFGERLSSANGAISVRLPRSVHAALLAEAEAEGVSLNQLCLSKLVAQLRAVV